MSKVKSKVVAPFTFLDDEEREIYEAIENENHVPNNLLSSELKSEVEAMARAKMNEERVKISLRLPQTDLDRLKAKAMREGMPYQTLINSILHKAVTR
jgi:predicted DNA binding CopG/RHH family protein